MRCLIAVFPVIFSLFAAAQAPAARHTVHVAPTGKADFQTVQAAIDSAPPEGLIVLLAPGVYKEKLRVTHPNVALVGTGKRPEDTTLTYNDSAKSAGGTSKSGSLSVSADGFQAENLSIVNSWWNENEGTNEGSQAVALLLTSDRAVIDRVRLLSGQDTLYAASLTCKGSPVGTPCAASREFFNDCYIEGHVDYIFGDAKAVFHHCELHSRPHPTVMLTAQSRHAPEEDSGYWMLHCRITGADHGDKVVLGRPWRDYATVTFFDTDMQQTVAPARWSEWDGRLKTATYREYDSHGPGAAGAQSIITSPPLTAAERAGMTPAALLKGTDHWDPEAEVQALRRLVH